MKKLRIAPSLPNAFTLAEVLITLGVIGVVAALTIPNLVVQHKEKQTITKLKKVYSTFSNAYMLTINEYGTPDTWDEVNSSSERTLAFWDRLKPNLNIVKECNFNNRFECWDVNDYYYFLNGTKSQNHIHNGNQKTFVLNDGTMVSFSADTYYDTGCSRNNDYFDCARIIVKTDNSKKQIYGKNIFGFRFEHSIFTPSGKNANMEDCSNLGTQCTAWAVFNENIEYTKCNDLSWTGKKKCN